MISRALGRVGAASLSVGLALLGISFALPAAAVPSAPVDVCENQQGTASDCVDPAPVGSVTTEIRDGGIVFTITGAAGTTWSRLALCIPGTTPSPANDCDTTSASVLDPAAGDYTVSGVAGASSSSTAVSFECTDTLVATVPRDTLSGVNNPIPWALELTNCGGGSDEAFGSASRGSASGLDYACVGVADLTATSARLGASTTDATVTSVEFTLTQGGTGTIVDTDASDGFSVVMSGLTPNTSYAYYVRFFNAEGTKVASEGGCLFATPASQGTTTTTSSTTTSTSTTSTTSTSTTSTTSTSTTSTTAPTSTTSTTAPTSTTSTTAPTSTTSTTLAGTSTSTTTGETTTTLAGERLAVLPTDLERPITGGVAPANLAAAGAGQAPAALARTGLESTLSTMGLSLVAFGGLALFAGRTRREDEDAVPAPKPHPRVPLGGGDDAAAPVTRRVVVRED